MGFERIRHRGQVYPHSVFCMWISGFPQLLLLKRLPWLQCVSVPLCSHVAVREWPYFWTWFPLPVVCLFWNRGMLFWLLGLCGTFWSHVMFSALHFSSQHLFNSLISLIQSDLRRMGLRFWFGDLIEAMNCFEACQHFDHMIHGKYKNKLEILTASTRIMCDRWKAIRRGKDNLLPSGFMWVCGIVSDLVP